MFVYLYKIISIISKLYQFISMISFKKEFKGIYSIDPLLISADFDSKYVRKL